MKHWKTSLAGFMASVGAALLIPFAGRPEWLNVAAPIMVAAGIFVGGLHQQDKNK
jgi:hypothetical protein